MSKLRQLIRESITEYIREIDEAGNMAALEAKMSKTQEAIDKRKKMAAMEGIDEAYHEMLDKGKMKEITSEIKVLEKSLTKYEKMLDKLKSKADKTPKVEEEKEIVDEVEMDVDLGEGEEMEEEMETKEMEYEGEINESFLHMQKLAGVITEAQYKAKRKALNEAEDFKVGETYTASMPTDSTGNKRMDIKVKFLGKNKMNGHDNFVVTPIQDVDYKNNESGQMNRFEKGKQYNTEAEFIK